MAPSYSHIDRADLSSQYDNAEIIEYDFQRKVIKGILEINPLDPVKPLDNCSSGQQHLFYNLRKP